MEDRQTSSLKRPLNRRQLLLLGRRIALGIGITPLLAACSIRTSRQRFTIEMSGPAPSMFLPGSLTITRGATIVWKNKDLYPHTVTCQPSQDQSNGAYAKLPKGAQPWDSGDLYTGQMWSYTFTTPGQYVYFSRRDETGRMLGSILVTG